METSLTSVSGEVGDVCDNTNYCNYTAYMTIIASAISFYFNNYFVLRTFAPGKIKDNARIEWKWRNTANSLIHSFITGLGACICFWSTPDMREDLINPYSFTSFVLVSFSIGYFLYDFMDMAVNDRKPKTYELLLHHCTVITCFGVTIVQKKYLGYALMALLVEVNSVFLHVRTLMILQGVSKTSSPYRINNSFTLGTFVVFRILTLGWMSRWLIHHRSDLSRGVFNLAGTSLAVIMIMNIILLNRLLNSDYRQCPKPPALPPAQTEDLLMKQR